MKKKILLIAIAVMTLSLISQPTQARSIWSVIWAVWFNPDKDWTTHP